MLDLVRCGMHERDHHIVKPYDIEAPEKFAASRKSLLDLVTFPIKVEHIGSSAVPGLGGKRVIDMMVLCEKRLMSEVVRLLESSGYKFIPAEGRGTFPERYFISGWFPYKKSKFHVHYHITFSGSSEHHDKLIFRDYLRRHGDSAEQYYELKSRHCVVDGTDVTVLPFDKEPFVSSVLEKARQERDGREDAL
jgi:GrpB-like predicted nucleotidyltransferase (UPF0157 family)